MNDIAISDLNRGLFEPHVGQIFTVALGGQDSYSLTLSATRDIVRRQQTPGRPDPFELRFTAPGPGWLQQGNYTLENPSFGRCTFFLVPINHAGSGLVYQAIFN